MNERSLALVILISACGGPQNPATATATATEGLTAEEQGRTSTARYDWLPTESAPSEHPVQIVSGNLYFADGTSIYIPDRRVVDNGWGRVGSTHVVGDVLKPLPVKMDLHWFSFTENEFYAGEYDLPFERISELFEQGTESPVRGEHITYDRIIVGMAPGGEVSVWLGAEAIALEVATYVAEETDTDWSAVLDNPDVSREDYIDMVLEESLDAEQRELLASEGVTQGLWTVYRQQYAWQAEFAGATPVSMWLRTLNGEHEYFDYGGEPPERPLRGMPHTIRLSWQNAAGQAYTTEIEFDRQEVVEGFRRLLSERADRQLALQIEISSTPPGVDVSLAELPLQRTRSQTFRARQ